jgi:hypothetical protein
MMFYYSYKFYEKGILRVLGDFVHKSYDISRSK